MTSSFPPPASSPSPAIAWRFAVWSIVAALLLVGGAVWVVLLRGTRILSSDAVLAGGQFGLGLFAIAMGGLLATTPQDAIKLRRNVSEAIILCGATGLQVIALGLLMPALSEDVTRYRLDGRMWLSGTSPYALTPDQWKAAGQPTDAVDRVVPHGHVGTIYPPMAEAIFATARAVEDRLAPAPDAGASSWRDLVVALRPTQRGMLLRALAAIAVLITTHLFLVILRQSGRSPWHAALFAWNPLIVLESAGMGHIDAVGIALMVAALWMAYQARSVGAGVLLALSAAVKPQAILLAPFVAIALGRSRQPRGAARFLCAVVIVLLAAYVPALSFDHGYAGLRETILNFTWTWEFNGSIYELSKWAFGEGDGGHAMERAKSVARLSGTAIVLGLAIVLLWRRTSAPRAGYWLFLTGLLVSPVVYPWYLLWPLALAPFLGTSGSGITALAWAAVAGASYVVWHEPAWRVPAWVAAPGYLFVYVAVAAELLATRATPRAAPASP